MMSAGRFNFERFTEVGKSFAPRVTIRENGQIGFTAGAINQYRLERYTHAVLFFDRQNNAVGILPVNDEKQPGAIQIKFGKVNTYLPAKSFLDKYGIDHTRSRRYAVTKEGDFLVFELEKPLARKATAKDK